MKLLLSIATIPASFWMAANDLLSTPIQYGMDVNPVEVLGIMASPIVAWKIGKVFG